MNPIENYNFTIVYPESAPIGTHLKSIVCQCFPCPCFLKAIIIMFIISEFTTRMESRSTPMPSSRKPPVRSSSNESQPGFEKTDGSQSDSALGSSITEGRCKRRPSLSHKIGSFVGLRRRSSSANQLAGTNAGQRVLQIYFMILKYNVFKS